MPTVLVVDDDDDHRFLAAMSLRRIGGWQVLEASDGRGAVLTARASTPDAILLDLVMPGLDGIATFQALQAEVLTRAIPVVLLTSFQWVGHTQSWDGLDLAGVLTKPFSATELPAQVAGLVGLGAGSDATSERTPVTARASHLTTA